MWEPWGVVVAEAKAAGMKIIVSDKVGARFDIPCDEIVPAGDAQALAAAMRRIEEGGEKRWRWTAERSDLNFWSCEAWAERVVDVTHSKLNHSDLNEFVV